jgi:thiamine-phosphate pyrophosphorylase
VTASPDPDRRLPPLHAVTDDRIFAAAGFLHAAEQVLEACGAGIALHLRAPAASGRALHAAATRLVPAAELAGARLVVNGRVDVAMATGAHGVHLPTRGLPPRAARRLLPAGVMIGASVHSEREAAEAVDEGVDYLLAGTLFGSASHPGRPPAGVALVRGLVALGVPVIGIGGITAARAPGVLQAGAAGVAVRGAIWDAEAPARAAVEILNSLMRSEP